MKSQMTRRQLLRYLGLGSVGVALAACQPKIVKETVIQEKVVKETVVQEKVVKETVVQEKVVKETVVQEKVVTPTVAPKAESPFYSGSRPRTTSPNTNRV
jgi:hypothetical protein